MTLQEAYRVLKRLYDWHMGKDLRGLDDVFPVRDYDEAVRLILSAHGLGNPIADCQNCKHAQQQRYFFCELRVKGECTRFEPKS